MLCQDHKTDVEQDSFKFISIETHVEQDDLKSTLITDDYKNDIEQNDSELESNTSSYLFICILFIHFAKILTSIFIFIYNR